MTRLYLGFVLMAVASCAPKQPQYERQKPDVGQFQVSQVGRRTLLVDTDDGTVWELTEDENGDATGWRKIPNGRP